VEKVPTEEIEKRAKLYADLFWYGLCIHAVLASISKNF